MALAAVFRQSRRFDNSLRLAIKPLAANGAQVTPSYRFKHQEKNGGSEDGSSEGTNWGAAGIIGLTTGIAATALFASSRQDELLAEVLAEEPDELEPMMKKEIIDQENRIRQFSRPETIFDYFAKYAIEKERPSIGGTKIRKQILMSVRDFYNAVTPGSSLSHGVGRGVYTIVKPDELRTSEMYQLEKLPTDRRNETSVLNEIQKEGLLTYDDFCFLVNILSTPRRYMDIAFHFFDVSADGLVEAKEFAFVMAAVTNYKGDPFDLLEDQSGLINYLFGKTRKKQMNKDKFMKFQQDLMNDVLWMEFTRYSKDNQTITDLDFCNHILLCANITSKKKKQMLQRVKKATKDLGTKGITFDMFKSFYYVLFGGSDLERAMFFLDAEKKGVNRQEFVDIARWVAGCEIDPHLVEIVYALLDDDNDGHLSIKEFTPVFFQWRKSRGFQHQSVQIAMGKLTI